MNSESRISVRRAIGAICISTVIIALGYMSTMRWQQSKTPAAFAAEPAQDHVDLGVTGSSSVVLHESGSSQTFVLTAFTDSPNCDTEQGLRLDSVTVEIMATANDEYTCRRPRSDVSVSIYDKKAGPPVASATLNYVFPMSSPERHSVRFDPPPILYATTTYTLVLAHDTYGVDVKSQLNQSMDLGLTSGYTLTTADLPNINNIGASPTGGKCTVPGNTPPPTVQWMLDDAAPYGLGEYEDPAKDGVATIHYSFGMNHNVLAVYYDPYIGSVTYSDTIGVITATYDAKLHNVQGWKSPESLAHELAGRLNAVSGGMVQVTLEEHEINDEWPIHKQGHLKWKPEDPSPVIDIPNWTSWTNNTWPFYKEIPCPSRRPCIFHLIPPERFDYQAFFLKDLRGDGRSITDLVNDGEVDEIWIISMPTSHLWESTHAVGKSGDGFWINGPPEVIPELEKTVTVMGFNNHRTVTEALHNIGHRVEWTLASLWSGNKGATCAANREDNHYNHYTRLYDCLEGAGTPIPPSSYGSLGIVHAAHNSPIATRTNINVADHGISTTSQRSDYFDWADFPDFPSPATTSPVNCHRWGCSHDGYLNWWFSNLPRGGGMEGTKYNNVWSYFLNPNCHPELGYARVENNP